MSDTFRILAPQVMAAGTDVPPEQIQAALNSLAQQVTVALNTLVGVPPAGPAGGDLSGTYPNPTVSAVHATSGTESGVSVTGNTINSSTIGATTPSTGAFTTLSASSTVSGSGFSAFVAAYLASPGAIGNTTPNSGAFTTLSASGTVSGVGFSNYLASPPAIGGTSANAATFTNLTASGTVGGNGFTAFLNSPSAIGGVAPNSGAFTTLSASSTVSGTGFSNYLASPPAIGGTAPAAGAFTTLGASGNDALIYNNTSGQSIPNATATTVTGWTKIADRLSANFNASTGVFTAPVTGWYHVDAGLLYAANTGAANSSVQVSIVANGVTVASGIDIRESATAAGQGCNVSAVVSLTSGQTVVIQAMQASGGAVALQTAAGGFNYVSIYRIP